MRRTSICLSLLGIALIAGGAGAAAGARSSTAIDRFSQSRIGRLVLGRIDRAQALGKDLGLSDAQREAIKSTLKSHKQEITRAVQPVISARRELRDTVLSSGSTESAIREAATDLGKKIGDAAVIIAKVKADVAAAAKLTPDQMDKLQAFRNTNDAAVDDMLKQVEQGQ